MPPVPSEIPEDVIRLYQEQLAQKDSQIAALTSLLHDSNTLLAQQQRVWESFLASYDNHPNAGAPPEDARHDSTAQESTRVTLPMPEPISGVTQAHGEEVPESPTFIKSSAMAEHRLNIPGPPSAGSHPDSDPISSVALTPLERRPDEAAVAAPVRQDSSEEPAHAPIPIAYFGSPLAGFAQNLKAAAAAKDYAVHSDEDDDAGSQKAYPLLASQSFGAATNERKPFLRSPLAGVLAVAAAVIALSLAWRALPGIVSGKGGSRQDSESRSATINKPAAEAPRSAAGASPSASAQRPEDTAPPRAAPEPRSVSTVPPLASKPQTTSTPVQQSAAIQTAHPGSAGAALDTSLVEAVANADLRRVQTLIAQGANVNARNVHSSSVLAMAARQGYTKITAHLLANGADANAANDRGWTALMLAVNYDHLKIVQALLQRGARTDLTNSQGTTALMLAAQNGSTEIVRLLLASGAPAMVKNNEGNSAQDLALKGGHRDIIGLLTKATSVTQ